jgi:hypothetical protein
MGKFQEWLFLTLFLFLLLDRTEPTKLLVIPAHGIISHIKTIYPALAALADNDHRVVILQLIRYDFDIHHYKHSNISSLILRTNLTNELAVQIPPNAYWHNKFISVAMQSFLYWKDRIDLCLATLRDKRTRRAYERLLNESWDFIFVYSVLSPCGTALANALRKRRGSDRAVIAEISASTLLPDSLWSRGIYVSSATYPTYETTRMKISDFIEPSSIVQRRLANSPWPFLISRGPFEIFVVQNFSRAK